MFFTYACIIDVQLYRIKNYLFWTCMHAKSLQSCLTFCDPMDLAYRAPMSMGFSKQEYWSRLPCPLPGYPPDPGIKPVSLISLALAGGLFTTEPPGKALFCPYMFIFAGTVLDT